MSAQTEREFQDAVIELARLCGWRIAHFRPAMNRRGQWSTPMIGDPGWVDLILVRPPTALFIELKSQHGALRLEQTEWITVLKACGVRAYVWRPSDWPTIEELLMGKPAGQSKG